MKQTLALVFSLALAGALLSGCERDGNRPAGTGSTATPSGSPSGSASGSAGGTTSQQQKRSTPAPASPTSPSGGTTGSK